MSEYDKLFSKYSSDLQRISNLNSSNNFGINLDTSSRDTLICIVSVVIIIIIYKKI